MRSLSIRKACACLAILFCLSSTLLVAQDLGGIWKGVLTQGPGGCYAEYFLELQINFSSGQVSGRTYDYYDTSRYVKMNFSGRYNPQTRRLVLVENRVLQANIPIDCIPCVKTYELTYSKDGKGEWLRGDWKGHISDRSSACPPGKITLKKAASSDFPTDIEQSDTLVALQRQLHLQPRTKEVVKILTVDTSQIRISLYDNAEIDNDSITVLINGKLVLYRQMLTDKPLTYRLSAFPGIEYELVMYADNLGSIPPNTALMVVEAGAKKMEVFLSSSESQSAAVKFIYKPREPVRTP
ncbi:MAG: hypothetical protein Q8937_12820 [Bacteroidota bacterium]|nr:hypothetical protein [Bacteroidota bacterium]